MILHFNAHLFADSRRLVKQAELVQREDLEREVRQVGIAPLDSAGGRSSLGGASPRAKVSTDQPLARKPPGYSGSYVTFAPAPRVQAFAIGPATPTEDQRDA